MVHVSCYKIVQKCISLHNIVQELLCHIAKATRLSQESEDAYGNFVIIHADGAYCDWSLHTNDHFLCGDSTT